MTVRTRIFHGPNIHAPFAAIMAEFTHPFEFQLPVSAIETQWHLIEGKPFWSNNPPPTNLSFESFASALAVHLQHPEDMENADVVVVAATGDQTSAIFLGYVNPEASTLALLAAIELTHGIFLRASGQAVNLDHLVRQLKRARITLAINLPQTPIVRTLIHVSRRRGIPIYPVAENSRIWLFGQGAAGIHFFEAASERDSFTGMQLSRDKTCSNKLVRRLGFPGVTHAVAKHKEEATRIAKHLGYPVVLKPISSGQGKGVSANVLDDEELGIAFANAAAFSPQGVIVERHVAGNDHRLAVFGGKLTWVVARYPASVVADGHKTVSELMDEENRRRREDPPTVEAGLKQLQSDEDMLLQLRKQGFSLTTRPPAGVMVHLRSVANTSKGGTIADLTDQLHPDNREMAEAIASTFRMDAMGIDFITPDISRSWREVPCAVIEVNGTPGFSSDTRAEKILQAKFPGGCGGRIPSVLLINPPAGVLARISGTISAKGRFVGQTDCKTTLLTGYSRCGPDADLRGRVLALVSDPRCDAMVIETTAEEIREHGLPLDKSDLVLCFVPLPGPLQQVAEACCHKLVNESRLDEPNEKTEALLEQLLSRYAHPA